jgi:hypothetical protein
MQQQQSRRGAKTFSVCHLSSVICHFTKLHLPLSKTQDNKIKNDKWKMENEK